MKGFTMTLRFVHTSDETREVIPTLFRRVISRNE